MLIGGKYRLTKQLGEGAMGVVWAAVNTATGGQVAIKLIVRSEPELRHRLIREAQACGAIRHKNVVQVHDVGTSDNGDPFLVMEHLQGETLAAMLARKRRLAPHEAASIARDVARALAAAHERGIVHRDLKPANIFLHTEPGDDAPVIKVVDFGVSKNLSQSDGLRTVAGGSVGSPMYMSPEQARAERDLDARADLWSLGVVLYEMLTGERPFPGDAAEVLHRILNEPIPRVAKRVRRIDPDLDRIVAGCLTRDAVTRLGPAAEIAKQLEVHTLPTARGPLPSLMDGAYDAPPVSGPASGGAPLSPGSGRAILQATSPGFGATELRAQSSGRPLAPVSSAYAASVLGAASSAAAIRPYDDSEGDDDSATRPVQSGTFQARRAPASQSAAPPAPPPPPSQAPPQPAMDWGDAGGGTIPIHLHAVMASAPAAPLPAPPPLAAASEAPPSSAYPPNQPQATMRMAPGTAEALLAAAPPASQWPAPAPAEAPPQSVRAPLPRDRSVLAALGVIAFSSIAAILIWRLVLSRPRAAGPPPQEAVVTASAAPAAAPPPATTAEAATSEAAPALAPSAEAAPPPATAEAAGSAEPAAAASAEPSAAVTATAEPAAPPPQTAPPPAPKAPAAVKTASATTKPTASSKTATAPAAKTTATATKTTKPPVKPGCGSAFSVNCKK